VNETIYPVDVVVPNSITEQNLTNNGINNIYLDEKFSVSFKSKFRFSPFKTYIYVTSTTDYGTIQLQYDSYMYDNILLEYEYVFNGTITDKYNSGTISYMFDLNGTIYNNKSAIATQLNVRTTSPPSLVSLSLDTQFVYSASDKFTYGTDGVLSVTSKSYTHTLSMTTYMLPLYVECTLKPIEGDTTILVTTDILGTRQNWKEDGGSDYSILWGTGAFNTTKYAWAVSGVTSDENTPNDNLRGNMTKFSMFIDNDQVIMYQGDGAAVREKYRRTRLMYPSFWKSVDDKGGKVRVGTFDWKKGKYTDFKIGSTNPWV
jgi:hypothetical protein